MNCLAGHFRRYREMEPWGFCWRIGVESTVAGLLAVLVVSPIFGADERQLLEFSLAQAFVVMVLLAPPIETLVFQAFPVFVVRMLGGTVRRQILVSTLLFAAAHVTEGVSTGVSAGVIGGLYYAFAYTHWRQRSRWTCFWVTTGCHAIHNGIGFVLLAVLGAFQ